MNILNTIYLIFILTGIVVPLFSLLLGGLDSLTPDLDLDLDGDGNLGVVPFNFNCLLFALVVVGAVGRLCNHYIPPLFGVLIAAVIGAGAYFAIYKLLIAPLKRHNAKAMQAGDALFRHVKVITKIPVGGTGEVQLEDASGSKITYLARYVYADFENRAPIETGAEVKVLDTEDNTLIVGRIF